MQREAPEIRIADAGEVRRGEPGETRRLAHGETPVAQHRDDSPSKDSLGLLQVGLGVTEVSEDVPASVNELDFFLTQGSSSFLGRARRARTVEQFASVAEGS